MKRHAHTYTDYTDDSNSNWLQYIELARKFSHLDYHGVYLIDLGTMHFVFMSDSDFLWGNYSYEDVKQRGMNIITESIVEEDRAMLDDISNTIILGLKQLPSKYIADFVMQLCFHISLDGDKLLVSHKISFLDIDANGIPHLLLGLATQAIDHRNAAIFASIIGRDELYIYDYLTHSWEKYIGDNLTIEERKMLHFSAQGYDIGEIATLMHRSIDTVKLYRRKIFDKLGVAKISDAITTALNYTIF